MSTKKEENVETTTTINDILNTTQSIKENKTDNQLQSEQLKKAKGISKCPRKKFKCSSVYAALYPDGYTTTYQGVIISLVFDNSTVELPEPIVKYVEDRLQRKADKEADKLNRFKTKKQYKLGDYQAE